MTATRKTHVIEKVLQQTSLFAAMKVLVENPTGKQNLVKVQQYKAEDSGSAGKRSFEGKSGRGKGQNVGRQMIAKNSGFAWNKKGNRATLLLGYKDLTSSKSGESKDYDFRTMIVADILNPQRNIEKIEVCQYFQTWQTIHTSDFPTVWPQCLPGQDAFLAENIKKALTIGAIIDLFNSKITNMKTALKKQDIHSISNQGLTYEYTEPTGHTKKLVHASDNSPVQTIPRDIDLIRLAVQIPVPDIESLYPDWTEIATKGKNKGQPVFKATSELLPLYVQEIQRLKDEYELLYQDVRPMELGVIEKAIKDNDGEIPEFVELGNTMFEIERNTTKKYELPSDTKTKLESGEYIEIEVPAKNGKWTLTKAATEKV